MEMLEMVFSFKQDKRLSPMERRAPHNPRQNHHHQTSTDRALLVMENPEILSKPRTLMRRDQVLGMVMGVGQGLMVTVLEVGLGTPSQTRSLPGHPLVVYPLALQQFHNTPEVMGAMTNRVSCKYRHKE